MSKEDESVKVYWLAKARMGQNVDQAKRDDTVWPMHLMASVRKFNFQLAQKILTGI